MVQLGDRFKFVPHGVGFVPAQIVQVTRVAGNRGFWCLFKKANHSETELLCEPDEVPGLGSLELLEQPRSQQHDEMSLEDWRRRIRNMR